jgi:biotin-dependent carboxylase-like uncharacterized protein
MSLIVDLGRPRSRSLGVPVGGAADVFAFTIGNALVGNLPNAPALEVCLVGPTLRAECQLACVVYGPDFGLQCDGQPLVVGKTFTLHAGETLQIGRCVHGLRTYLCVLGGIDCDLIMESRSALEPIRKDQVLRCRPGAIGGRFIEVNRDWQLARSADGTQNVRVLPGAQATWFPPDVLSGGTDQPKRYRVSQAANRMGLRLEGDPLPWPGREMVSEPVCPGSIQVTPDGQCIILGVDGQTIGGYPKVAQVISADLDLLGQLRPGDRIAFLPASLEEAEELAARRQQAMLEWLRRLQQ